MNRINVTVTDWQLMHAGIGSDRARLRVEFDVPMHQRLTAFDVIPGLHDALATFISGRAQPRWRRIWEAIR